MNCKNCGAPMRPVSAGEYFACDHCLSFHFPERSGDGVAATGEAGGLACPVCREELVIGYVRRHRVQVCPRCQGVLVKATSLAILVDELRARHEGPRLPPRPLEAAEQERRLECPSCHGPMDLHPYYGPGRVLIDTCGACALVWLDRGEIATIARS